jgi:shikimate kinase / 3-dehydroquinate synthase
VRLFLTGSPAAGKTTVGRRVAQRLGWGFVDTDEAVATVAGRSVSELVQQSLSDFRTLEASQVLAAAQLPGPVVVSTGGGAVTWHDNLKQMKQTGLVIALTVDVDTALSRAGVDPQRPLMQDREAAIGLWRQRAEVYRQAHCVIGTQCKGVDDVVNDVIAVIAAYQHFMRDADARGPAANFTWLALQERSYPVVATADLQSAAAALHVARRDTVSQIAVVCDDNTKHLAQELIDWTWSSSPQRHCHLVGIAPGESSKSFAQYEMLCNQLLSLGLDRSSQIFAVGGGVVGDLAGFVAATLFRGIAVTHIATTLLAMVDSAIGGKTAIDTGSGKNQIGAFWQPTAVYAPLSALTTLPPRERISGFGELWKYAVLDGESLWSDVAQCTSWARTGGTVPAILQSVIMRCAAYKAAIVSADERERTGLRALLNLGHTVGHAIETFAAGELTHGESVGLGLIAAARISAALPGAEQSVAQLPTRLTQALAATGLPIDLAAWLTPEVFALLAADKKRVGESIGFVVVRSIGHCEVVSLPLSEIEGILRFAAVS